MFLTPPETEQSFKASIDALIRNCLNKDRKIIPEQLPKYISVGSAAWLIESIKQRTVDLDMAAIKAAERLHANISQLYYKGDQDIKQADVAYDFEGKAHCNFIIKTEVLVEYINMQPFYSDMLVSASSPLDSRATEHTTHQTSIQVIQNNFDLTISNTDVLNNIETRIHNSILYPKESAAIPSPNKEEQPKKSACKDAYSEALSTIILEEKLIVTKDINLAKLCWEKLPEALKKIGCTGIIQSSKGAQNKHSIQAKHETLNTPLITFQAFRQRMIRLYEFNSKS